MSARCVICGTLLERAACARCGGRIARADLLLPARRGGPIGEAVVGLRLALRGVRLTLTRPRLFLLVVLPVLLNLALFAVLAWWLFGYREWAVPDRIEGFLGPVAGFIGGLVAIVAAALATFLLSSVVAAPFLEWISESVETLVFGHGDERPITAHYVWNVWLVPLFQALLLALAQGVLGALVLLLSLTGVLAPLVLVAGVWLVAITLCDIVIARKRYAIRARFRLVNRSWPLFLGAALPFALVPMLLPLGVAGATLAYLRDRRLRGAAQDAGA